MKYQIWIEDDEGHHLYDEFSGARGMYRRLKDAAKDNPDCFVWIVRA